jgi:CheY-like chemotaxis protein
MNILLVDDSAADVYLAKLALHEALPESQVRVVEDGEQALHYLAEGDQYRSGVHPDLILLDLNIPGLDGFSLLARIKTLPGYQSTPVIFLTSSSRAGDIQQAYQLGALKYFTKPANWKDYIALGYSIAAVWDQWCANSHNLDGQISHQ